MRGTGGTDLRDPFGRDEAAGFNGLQACRCQAADQLELGFDWDAFLFVLEAIAWADFDDTDKVAAWSRGCEGPPLAEGDGAP